MLALSDLNGVSHFAALWLRNAINNPRAAFDVIPRHVQASWMLCFRERVKRASRLNGPHLRRFMRRDREPLTERPSF